MHLPKNEEHGLYLDLCCLTGHHTEGLDQRGDICEDETDLRTKWQSIHITTYIHGVATDLGRIDT